VKLGIVGLPGSGKSTVFRALTGATDSPDRKGHQEAELGVVTVEDPRLDFLAAHYNPKKVTPVHVEYTDIPGLTGEGKPGRTIGDRVLALIRPLDALVHCVRFFHSSALGATQPLRDFMAAEEEMILSDMATVEKRLERVTKDVQRGKKELGEELRLLEEAKALLDQGKPLRVSPQIADADVLKGFAFLSAKPELVLLNAGETESREDVSAALAKIREYVSDQPWIALDWLYADTEAEIARLSPEEAREFLADMHVEQGAKQRITKASFDLLNLIVFFTAGEPEARAWPLERGKSALKAAGTVHSDMERGFIRAEVVAFDDFKAAGSLNAAHKVGKVRLEGRDYEVKDGDMFLFRFNV
jgi:ribosome-binding ATPase